MRDWRTGGDTESTESGARGGTPGATTRTAALPVQRKAAAPEASEAKTGDPEAAGKSREMIDTMYDFNGGGFEHAANIASALPHREQMESAFGRDFSGVQASTGQSEAMGAIGAQAAACGNQVQFAETAPSPWLVAHELTHVVQSEQAPAAGVSRHATIGPVDSAAEREADAVADRVVRGEPVGEISAVPAAPVQRFAPGNHEAATVAGLSKTFSKEEIGATYASNWERDFSQGAPEIANAAIAWRAVKLAAAKNGGDPGKTADVFKSAVWKVVDMDLTASTNESLGNYKYWEHMDQPTGGDRKSAEERWKGKTGGLGGYIMDAKAFIKDQMLAAVDTYRGAKGLGMSGGGIDNWNGAAKPEGYVSPNTRKGADGKSVLNDLPAGWDPKNVDSRDPLREQTENLADAAGAKSDPKHDEALWRVVGQLLGRAMHAFEDFWAHSNWLELANGLVEAQEEGKDQKAVANSALKTGTFGMASKAHALGHKLLAMSEAFLDDFPLMLKVYGQTEASTKISQSKRRPWYYGIDSDSDDAFDGLVTDSATPIGEIADVGRAANAVEELVQSGDYTMADFLCNKEWLEALKKKGQILIAEGDKESDADSHGHIAKDQDEHGKDHSGAQKLANKANELTFAPLRAIMDERDVEKATAAITTQLKSVDDMLQAPSTSHPLWSLVKSFHSH